MSATGNIRLWAMGLLGALAFVGVLGGGASRAAVPPDLSILGDPLSFKSETGNDGKTAWITVLNPGPSAVRVTVAYAASSQKGVALKPSTPVNIDPGAARRFQVTFTGLKDLPRKVVHGQLVVSGGAKPIAQEVTITPARNPSTDWPLVFTIGSFVAFCVLLLVAYGSAVHVWVKTDQRRAWETVRAMYRSPAPGPDWTPTGWISNLTAVGALLGATVAAVTFPDVPREIDQDTLITMNLAFGALLVVGPFLFQSVRCREVRKDWNLGHKAGKDLEKPGLWGWKWALMLSYSLTTVAVFGQLGALALLGWELTREHLAISYAIVALAVILGGFALCYFEAMMQAQWRGDWLRKAQNEKDSERDEEPLKFKHFPLTAGQRVQPSWEVTLHQKVEQDEADPPKHETRWQKAWQRLVSR